MKYIQENIKYSQAIKAFMYCCKYFKDGKCECTYDRLGNPYQCPCDGIKCQYVKDFIKELTNIVENEK